MPARCPPSCPPSCPPRGEPMDLWPPRSVARELSPELSTQLSPRVASLRFFSLNSLPVGGFSRVSREPVVVFAGRRPRKPDVYSLIRKIIKDPPTQAVENITPLQKTSHMLCSWATADTGVASLTKCVQTDKSENYALPKNGAVGGHFATV